SSSFLPLDLPSFPTRRSSDLGLQSIRRSQCRQFNFQFAIFLLELVLQFARSREHISHLDHLQSQPYMEQGHSHQAERQNDENQRSEEHTSELQSRVELVCRLL